MSGITRIGLALGLAGVAMGVAGCDSSTSSAQDPRTRTQLVRVTEVQPSGDSERSYTGVVAARVQSNLTFRVAGKVTERLVDAGQTVKFGQPLMRVDRTDYEHAITAQRGNVDAAKARLTQAVADEARFQSLIESGAVSRSAYDQAKAAADSARALFDAAQAQLKVVENDGRYATLVADADGVVMETLAEPGQFVAAGQIVMRLAQAGPREAAVYLPETVRPAIGSTADASLYGAAEHQPARLRQLSDAADPLTRTFEARYVLDGKAASAPLGGTVTIHILSRERPANMVVPLGAIDDRGQGPGVWIVDGQASTVTFRPVKLIELNGEQAIVGDGLHLGEHIVALGGHDLHDGQNIRVADQLAGLK
jgi:RND family efflux transporter MFP subunit